MSSTSEAMANQGLLYEDQDHHHQISTTQMGFLPFFPPNLSFVNPPLSCHQSTLKSFTNTTTPSSLPAPAHVHHLPSSAETLLSSHTKQRVDIDSDVLGGANLLSLQRSSTPTNLWTWGDINQSLSNKRNSTVDDYDNHHHHHHHHLGVTAMKMKKIKARRKVREPRFCFKTMSDVDVLDDGYKWRKYGQKVVKNTQHPRSYYRCTQDNCRVKKRVERLAEDPRMVITTYEGRHVHSPSHDQEDSSQTQCQLNNLFW